MRLKRGGGDGKGGRPVLYFTGAVKFRIWFSPPPFPGATELLRWWWWCEQKFIPGGGFGISKELVGVSSSTGLKCQIAWVRWRESDSGQNWPKEEVALKINFFKALFVRLG